MITRAYRTAALVAAAPFVASHLPAQDRPVISGALGQRLDSALRAAETRGFHGNVLVAQDGQIALLAGYGLANHEQGLRFGPSTVVPIGSNTKDFTKVAIYQLVEQGRLRLTDSLPRFFESVPADKRGITVEHLLDHTAGLPLGFGPDERPLSSAEWQTRLFAATLESPPGTRRRYSNAGYSALAAIIEQLTGRPYDAYLAEHVFRPSGMTETGLVQFRTRADRLAHAYAEGRDRGTMLDKPQDENGHLWSLRGNGGHVSTLSDMRRFYRALRDNTLLGREEHRRAVLPADGPSVLAGSDLTSFFLFANYPRQRTEVFITSNHREAQGNRLLRALLPILGIAPPEERRVEVSAPLMPVLPQTGIGRTVAAYLEAYNSGDSAVMRRFFEERGAGGPEVPPVAVRLERFREMRGNLGRLTIRGARQASDGLAVVAQSENGETVTLTFIVESEAPYRLLGIRVEVG